MFLAPLFLLGLLAIGVPIWLHRVARANPTQHPFASLMFLEASETQRTAKRTLRYWVLLSLRILLLIALVLAFAAPVLTRLPPARLSWLLSFLTTRALRDGALARPDLAARIERSLAIAARFRRQTCMTRGITRFVMFRRAGIPVELVFGLGAHEAIFSGHCWLELEAQPYLESHDPRPLFPELFRVPRAVVA